MSLLLNNVIKARGGKAKASSSKTKAWTHKTKSEILARNFSAKLLIII